MIKFNIEILYKGGIDLEPLKYYQEENALKFYLLDCRFRINEFNYFSR
jgi:hypothetical protein